MNYQFTNEWFTPHAPVWAEIIEWVQPSAALEIGSYEGRSTCFLIEQISHLHPAEIHCIDTWKGGVEHSEDDMAAVEDRFDRNISIALEKSKHPVDFHKHKGESRLVLPELLVSGMRDHFDLVYVDGSHKASDVLFDAVVSFSLLKEGGVIIFDDYLWQMEEYGLQDHYNLPKPAIDAFFNVFRRKLRPISAPLYQLYIQKVSD